MKQYKQYCLSTPIPVVSLSSGKTFFVPLFFVCFASHSLPNVHEPDTWGQISALQKLNDRKKTFLWFLILWRLLKFTCNKALQRKKKKTRGRGELIRRSGREARSSSERRIHLLFTKLPSGACHGPSTALLPGLSYHLHEYFVPDLYVPSSPKLRGCFM